MGTLSPLDRVIKHDGDFIDGERLLEKVEGAHFGSFHSGLNGAVSGDDDYFGAIREGDFLDAGKGFEAIHTIEPDIQQHHFVARPREFFQAFLAAFDGGAEEPLVLQHSRERLANARFVVDNQNPRGLHARASASAATVAGMST
jgi:hypothetical protein